MGRLQGSVHNHQFRKRFFWFADDEVGGNLPNKYWEGVVWLMRFAVKLSPVLNEYQWYGYKFIWEPMCGWIRT